MATYLKYDRYVDDSARVSQDRMDELKSKSLSVIDQLQEVSERNIIAFSGGKDSLVMTHLLRRAGYEILDAVCETSFMFTDGLNHTKTMARRFGLQCEFRSQLSWEWLKKNPKWVEPPMKIQGQLYSKRQQASVKHYSKINGFTGVLYGRRKDENNVPSELYQLKNGQWQCHPLADWTTHDVWSYIHSHNISYPDQYKHEIGRKEGFSSFLLPPEHFGGSTMEALYSFEPDIVTKLAEFYEPAKQYLSRVRYSDKP